MDCRDAQLLIAGFVDRELDPRTDMDVDRHFGECLRCAEERDRQIAVKQAVRSAAPYYSPPESLLDRIRVSLDAAGDPAEYSSGGLAVAVRADASSDLAAADRAIASGDLAAGVQENSPGGLAAAANADSGVARRFRLPESWRAWALAAAFLLVFVSAFGIGRYTAGRSQPVALAQGTLAQEVVACHIRSLMAAHLTDVISTDKHTVKPWYAGRLSFSPPVEDFAARGYPLVGGRMDYVDGHQAAALVYRFRKHVINAFVWPASGAPMPETTTRLNGYNVVQWSDSEMTWAVVSDLNGQDLERFAGLLRNSEGSSAAEPSSMGLRR